ncbi:hypothetical protein JCM8097_008091 [Rhodosporidiobolus ruineniae]
MRAWAASSRPPPSSSSSSSAAPSAWAIPAMPAHHHQQSAWAANPLPAASAHAHSLHAHSNSHHPNSHSAAQDRVQSASTVLDRVLAMLDGFEDDMDCPLCLEEMDLSDLNFKPCPCGYQICRFCYHHIKENLNNKCPACRTPYDDSTVDFKPIKPDEMKRLQAAKKLRDKRKKDAELAMQNKASVRVRLRTQVHITGLTTKTANEDTLNQLKGADHFGQYGKVLKLFMSKRSPAQPQPGVAASHYQPVNVYVNYRTPAEASHCIAATDGTVTPEGNKLKAVWGTTRYCPNYLKGIRCHLENCMLAHEQGDELEGVAPSTKDEIFTYDNETAYKPKPVGAPSATTSARKQPEASLPATASWASKNAPAQPTTPIILNPHLPPLSATLPKPPPPRPASAAKTRPSSRQKQAAAAAAAAAAAIAAGESPLPSAASLPDAARVPSSSKGKAVLDPARVPSPAELAAANAAAAAAVAAEEPVASTSRSPSPPPAAPSPAPSPPIEASYLNGFLGYGPSQEVSTLPFPDLEFGEGGFSFSLDLDVKGKGRAAPPVDEPTPFRDFANFEGFVRPEPSAAMETGSSFGAPSYMGSFDPFAESTMAFGSNDLRSDSPTPPSTAEDELSRRSSRFGFARRGSGSHGFKGFEEELPLPPSSGAPLAPPPGIGAPLRGAGFNPLPPPSGDSRDPFSAPAFPPGVLRSLASPAASATPSPQLSPRSRGAGLPPPHGQHAQHGQHPFGPPPPGLGGPANLSLNGAPAGAANSALPHPPGLMPGRGAPIPAASFPLPPPAPRPSNAPQGMTTVAKEDLLALIAAAQASAPKQQEPQQPHPFFSDPAILNARLAAPPGVPSPMDQLPPSFPQQQQGQQQFPPGMRLPPFYRA